MKAIQFEQIKIQELKLLEINGYSLAQCKNNQGSSRLFKEPTSRQLPKALERLQIITTQSFGLTCNANLRAFGYILLKNIFEQQIRLDLLSLIKSVLYHQTFNLTNISNHPLQNLSNNQMKNLLVQFFYSLEYSSQQNKIKMKLQKYPSIMDILVLFLRCLLKEFNVKNAGNYLFKIKTAQAFPQLVKCLDINCEISRSLYLFNDNRIFMVQSQQGQSLIGHYLQNKCQTPNKYIPNKRIGLDFYEDEKFEKSIGQQRKGYIYFQYDEIDDNPFLEQEASTPSFSLQESQQNALLNSQEAQFRKNQMKQSRDILYDIKIKMSKQPLLNLQNIKQIEFNDQFNEHIQNINIKNAAIDIPENILSDEYFSNQVIFQNRQYQHGLCKQLKKSKSENGEVVAQKGADYQNNFYHLEKKINSQHTVKINNKEGQCYTCSCTKIKINYNKLESNIYQINMNFNINTTQTNNQFSGKLFRNKQMYTISNQCNNLESIQQISPYSMCVSCKGVIIYETYSLPSSNIIRQNLPARDHIRTITPNIQKNHLNNIMFNKNYYKMNPNNNFTIVERQFTPLNFHTKYNYHDSCNSSKQIIIPTIKINYKNQLKYSAYLSENKKFQ